MWLTLTNYLFYSPWHPTLYDSVFCRPILCRILLVFFSFWSICSSRFKNVARKFLLHKGMSGYLKKKKKIIFCANWVFFLNKIIYSGWKSIGCSSLYLKDFNLTLTIFFSWKWERKNHRTQDVRGGFSLCCNYVTRALMVHRFIFRLG